jgi:CBS domain-containing protein
MCAVANAILEPPTALSVLKHPVAIATPQMQLSAAATLMLDRHFSQLPIVDKRVVVDVLTSEALARFLTDVVCGGGTAKASSEVGEVAGHDPQREVISRPGSVTALAVVDEFEKREGAGRLLNALCLMGEGGRDVLGIATVYDLPALIKAARPLG